MAHGSPLLNGSFPLAGNVFVNGNNFTVFTRDRLVCKQYWRRTRSLARLGPLGGRSLGLRGFDQARHVSRLPAATCAADGSGRRS